MGFYYLVKDVRPREAIRQLGHSLALREQLGDPRRIPSGLMAQGEAELVAGSPERAASLFERAARLARDAGLAPWLIHDAENSLRTAPATLAGSEAAS